MDGKRSMTRASLAKQERERKEKHPEAFCAYPGCLWRNSGGLDLCPMCSKLANWGEAPGGACPACHGRRTLWLCPKHVKKTTVKS
jgi:hypothetical protein